MKITRRQLRRIIREEKNKLIAEIRIKNVVARVLNEANGSNATTIMLSKEIHPGVSSFEIPQMFTYGKNASDTVDAIIDDFGAYADKTKIKPAENFRKPRRYKKEDTRELVNLFTSGIRDTVDTYGALDRTKNYGEYLPFITGATGYRAEELNKIISQPVFKEIAQGFAKGLYDQNYKVIKKKKKPVKKLAPKMDLGTPGTAGYIESSNVTGVMNQIADYYRSLHGSEAEPFIQGNPTIRDFISNDLNGIENMAKADVGPLIYDPENDKVSNGEGYEAIIPPELADIARQFYDEGQYLPAFLHLITGTQLYMAAETPSGRIIYN